MYKIIKIISIFLIITILTMLCLSEYCEASFIDFLTINNEENHHDVLVPDEVETEAKETIDETCNGKCVWTVEELSGNEIIDEINIENDGTVSQENISFDGDISGGGLHLLGAYQGRTYYNQRR